VWSGTGPQYDCGLVSSLKDEIQPLFRDVLLVCDKMNLLGGSEFAIDGLKLPSNASKSGVGG